MKRALPLILAVLLVLSGCGASSGADSGKAESMDTYRNDMVMDMSQTAAGGWAEKPAEEAEVPSPVPTTAENSPLANAKLIYRADLSLQSKEFDTAMAALDNIVSSLGGYYESKNLYQGGTYRSLHGTVRIPAENFTLFLEQAGQAAHVTDRSEYKEDVSEAYYDVEARLTTQRTKMERLQDLLARAESMEDIIQLENAISETELQIEYLTGSLRKYDSLIGFSTITVNLHEVYRLSTDEEVPVTFVQRLTSAFALGFERGVNDLEDFVIDLARNWMDIIVLAAVAAAAVLLVRRGVRRRRGEKKGKLPPEPSGEDEEK